MTAGRVPRDGRRLRTQAHIAWSALAADAVAFGAIVALVDFDSLGTAGGIAVMGLPIVAAIALVVWGLSSSADARRFDRLGRAEVVVASWIVDADTWRERRAARQVPGRRSAPRGIVLDPVGKPPQAGTEIVVTHEAIYIGASYMAPLVPNMVVTVEIRDGWIELEFDSETLVLLWVPIGRHGHAEADKVARHFRQHFGSVSGQASPPGGR